MSDLPVMGDTLVLLPHRDHLFITGSESKFGLRHCLSAVKELQEQPGALPPILLKLVDEFYHPYELPKEHPAHSEFKALSLGYLDRLYAAQKADLEARFEQVTGRRIVSKFKFSDDRFQPFSSSYVGKDLLPCLLPKTDFIFFGGNDEPEAICSWERAEAILKEKFEGIDCYPRRYEVSTYPSEQELERMGFEKLPD